MFSRVSVTYIVIYQIFIYNYTYIYIDIFLIYMHQLVHDFFHQQDHPEMVDRVVVKPDLFSPNIW